MGILRRLRSKKWRGVKRCGYAIRQVIRRIKERDKNRQSDKIDIISC